jgi:BirA family transcriptional regulator, biotin operon repressor / biotin---[acetyl-CoA-carboxylase] ligase
LIAFVLETLPAVGSTNDVVRERALAGAAEGLVVRAEEQLAGRGRHGRVWASPPGNLYASLLLRPHRPLAEAATLSLVIGLSLADAIAGAAPSGAVQPRLKWPNDVLLGGAKLAGILLENVGSDPASPVLVVGFGVNVAHCPEGLPYPATTLRSAGLDLSPADLLDRFLRAFAADYALWGDRGFAALRQRWLARAERLGSEAGVMVGERAISGRFVDVDPAGRLVLDSPSGRETLNAGELFFATAPVA